MAGAGSGFQASRLVALLLAMAALALALLLVSCFAQADDEWMGTFSISDSTTGITLGKYTTTAVDVTTEGVVSVEYDAYSIMHYPMRHADVSNNISSKFIFNDSSIDTSRVGDRSEFTFLDKVKIRNLYFGGK